MLVCHSLTNTLNSFKLYLCLHFVSFGQGHGKDFFLGGKNVDMPSDSQNSGGGAQAYGCISKPLFWCRTEMTTFISPHLITIIDKNQITFSLYGWGSPL